MKQFNNIHRTKRSLGQNFLTNQRVAAKIVASADLRSNDTVLEIGPGRGIITETLLHHAGKVIAVEKDDELFVFLQEKFSVAIKNGILELIHSDILAFDPTSYQLQTTSYKLVANIPYNITGQIIRKFLTASAQPISMTLLVQKEVAERIVAHDHKESLLSLGVKVYGTPHLVQRVAAGNFFPKPKVDSAILHIGNISRDFFREVDENQFFNLLHAGFAHKRKLLISNLCKGLPFAKGSPLLQQAFMLACINEKARAEELGLEDWHRLFFCL